ncbi:hypothetical protein HJG53_00310 [Sphingomonas sp. ID1715]|uniref:hypothetical protein n=1 Tax=Sphingomonas sp. ID1715 TaxID=1656898 RepID=UPI00148959B5|nr:hypothetical protein [Sphingomonas sp. ID1715]NNM75352.1 hypothetical protein [Sphingomonas sp. ID1715]
MADITRTVSNPTSSDAAEMERLGITATTATYFHWRGYRYTTARDALHAARHAERASPATASG